jgi:hypothetical protein
VFAALNKHQKNFKSFGSESYQISVAEEQLSAGVKTVGARTRINVSFRCSYEPLRTIRKILVPALGHFTGALRTIPLIGAVRAQRHAGAQSEYPPRNQKFTQRLARHFWIVRQENLGSFKNAKEMIMKPSTIAKTLTIAAVTALVLGIGPKAKAEIKDARRRT